MVNDQLQLLDNPAERRKQVRLKVRSDLHHVEQRYEGKVFHVIKDPVCLRYYRFNKQEYFVFNLFDGTHSMEDVRKEFENEYRPHRLEFQDLEAFARQLVTAGLVQHETAGTGKHLFQRRAKQRNMRRLAAFTNILYIKIPVFDPDRLLTWMYQYLWWIFTTPFFIASVGLMLAAILQVTLHFQAFYDKMPEYQEFFAYQTLLYMWLSLGVVKIIHEFGHGLSCKAFKGECHEMGVLLMCFSPALYANVSDAWTVADKWKRIIISFAGIYVELCIAAISTFVWWFTPHMPVVNNVAMCLMVLCSVSTVIFNANPLMRFDGYYMLADWIEIPNLRDRANRYLNNLFLSIGLGVEVPPEGYMAPGRKTLFVIYAIGSYIYRWIVTFGVIWFLADFLHPKLKVLSVMLACLSLASMFIMPGYKMIRNIRQRGRAPDMKKNRVYATVMVASLMILAFFLVPIPISRVRESGLVVLDPAGASSIGLTEPAVLTGVAVLEGETVGRDQKLAAFVPLKMREDLADTISRRDAARVRAQSLMAVYKDYQNRENADQLKKDANSAELQAQSFEQREELLRRQIERVGVLKSPQPGVAVGVPRSTEIGKQFDLNTTDQRPVVTIADPTRLLVRVPISALDYRLLKENMPASAELDVDLHIQGRTDKAFGAKLRKLPDSDEKKIPPQLTQQMGGPIAMRNAGEGGQDKTPVAQVFMLEIEITDREVIEHPGCIRPGTVVQVKIYCQWRSAAWWVGRKLHEAVDGGLIW